MEITITIPAGSKLEEVVRNMIKDKNEIHQELSKGNTSVITQKGRKIVRVSLPNR
ncbi:hypothetical protein P1X15_25610 [Runella sp. MFBS21]|uniref:hypothetical protein n=1 Tax=Runella TaxID=105 RepID=UPI00041597A4|nr:MULTISPECIES: hypothetical protein [Runella]MDF7821026.1 hypothetical protein [Runella sp. MFBS21]